MKQSYFLQIKQCDCLLWHWRQRACPATVITLGNQHFQRGRGWMLPSCREWVPYTMSLHTTQRWSGSNHNDTPREGALTPPSLPLLQRTRDIQGDLWLLVRKWWKKKLSQNQCLFSPSLLPSSTRGVCVWQCGLLRILWTAQRDGDSGICFVRDQPWLVRGGKAEF